MSAFMACERIKITSESEEIAILKDNESKNDIRNQKEATTKIQKKKQRKKEIKIKPM